MIFLQGLDIFDLQNLIKKPYLLDSHFQLMLLLPGNRISLKFINFLEILFVALSQQRNLIVFVSQFIVIKLQKTC